jgi:hypothetical protein
MLARISPLQVKGGGLDDKKAKILTPNFINEHIWWDGI